MGTDLLRDGGEEVIRRSRIVVALVAVVAAIGAAAAYGTWLGTVDGTAAARSQTIAGTQPVGIATGSDVALTWTASAFSDGVRADRYTVRRYTSPAGVLQTVLADCAGDIAVSASAATVSCTEHNVPAGSWQYSVTPKYLTWTGTEGTKSIAVVVAPAAPVDTTPPTTTATPTPAANGAGWHTANVSVALSATDSGSAVKQVTYSATGAQPITSTTVLGSSATVPTITTEGTTTVSYFAEDVLGNKETAKTLVVKLDKTAPTGTAGALPTRIRNGQSLTGAYNDSGTSGLASVTYRYCPVVTATCDASNSTLIGTATSTPYTVVWNSQPTDGEYKVVANVTDNAQNATLVTVGTTSVDNTAPAGAITGWVDPSNGNTKVQLSGTGEAGAVVTVVICTTNSFPCASGNTKATLETTVQPNGTWLTSESGNVEPGTRYARATVTDAAGNVTTTNVFSFTQ